MQIISRVLDAMSESAEIYADTIDEMRTRMLIRMVDKLPVVRVQAIKSLHRFQDPTDDACPVIEALVSRVACDSSADVRAAALAVVAINSRSLAAIIAATRDVKV